MKFNYNVYRPKQLVQDVRKIKINSAYFRSKDVHVTPFTKIGDAYKLHEEQATGRLPILAKRLKPQQLSLKVKRRRSVAVHDASDTKKIRVRILAPRMSHHAPSTQQVGTAMPPLRPLKQFLAVARGQSFLRPVAIGLLVIGMAGVGGLQLTSGKSAREPGTATVQPSSSKTTHPLSPAGQHVSQPTKKLTNVLASAIYTQPKLSKRVATSSRPITSRSTAATKAAASQPVITAVTPTSATTSASTDPSVSQPAPAVSNGSAPAASSPVTAPATNTDSSTTPVTPPATTDPTSAPSSDPPTTADGQYSPSPALPLAGMYAQNYPSTYGPGKGSDLTPTPSLGPVLQSTPTQQPTN